MTQYQRARPTLEQVARAAGVSKPTASKVLNRRPHVSDATRRRVEDAIEHFGYVPTTGPREENPLQEVHVVFNTVLNAYVMEVLHGVLSAAPGHGVEVLVASREAESGHSPAAAQSRTPLSSEWIRHLASRRRAGIILVTTELPTEQRDLLRQLDISLVAVDPLGPMDETFTSVGSTNFNGGRLAAQHLLQLGHRRIGFAGGPPLSMAAQERNQGFLSSMRAAGVSVDTDIVYETSFSFDAGLDMGHRLLNAEAPPTAVLAGSDRSALGVIESAKQHGLTVPEDLSVVGFDDTYSAMPVAPALTTVRQPLPDMGRAALRTLLQLSRVERPDSHHVELTTQLIVRDSTAAPRA